MNAPNPFIIITIIIILFALFALWFTYYDQINDNVEKAVIRLLGVVGTASINGSKVETSPFYALYDDQWISGIESLGTVVQVTQNISSSVICSNILHGAARNLNAVAANYYPDTRVCRLVNSILPVNVNPSAQFILRSSSLTNNNVTTWTNDDTVNVGGSIFCATSLSYLPYLKAMCAATGNCAAYTIELDETTGAPTGCLKYSNQTFPALNVSTYTGTRNDAKPLSQNFNYTFDTTIVNGNLIGSVINNVNIEQCGAYLLKQSTSSDGGTINAGTTGVWDYSNGGTCAVYDISSTNAQKSKSSTLLKIAIV